MLALWKFISPRIPEWAAYPFSSRSSEPSSRTGFSCIAGVFFTSWATREALASNYSNDYKVSHWSFLGLVQDLRKIHFCVSPTLTYTFFFHILISWIRIHFTINGTSEVWLTALFLEVVLVIQSCPTLWVPMDCSPARFLCLLNSPGKDSGVGSHSSLQGIFLTQD